MWRGAQRADFDRIQGLRAKRDEAQQAGLAKFVSLASTVASAAMGIPGGFASLEMGDLTSIMNMLGGNASRGFGMVGKSTYGSSNVPTGFPPR